MTGPAGRLRVVGRLVDASNATLLTLDEDERRWVYKPIIGEAPLWDFPSATLSRREVAAYALSETLGFSLVPETVWVDGPLGEGSAQAWVDGDTSDLVDLLRPEVVTAEWLPVLAAQLSDGSPIVLAHRDDAQLRRVALFDALLNNSDRKAGHLLVDGDRLAGIDHGVSLHVEDKLRTVLWGWAGDPLRPDEIEVATAAAALDVAPAPGLADEEWEALRDRADSLLANGVFPLPSERWHRIPWPPI